MIARVVIWNLYDSKTTLDELRERFGLLALGDELPDLGGLPELLGVEAVVFEEYDVE